MNDLPKERMLRYGKGNRGKAGIRVPDDGSTGSCCLDVLM